MLVSRNTARRRMRKLLAYCCWNAVLALSAVSVVLAQTNAAETPAAARPAARIAIRAGRLLDVRTGNYASNVYILVEGDRIASVGATAPAGASIIDLSSQTVLPGLADSHAHILGNPKNQSATASLRMSSPMAALW